MCSSNVFIFNQCEFNANYHMLTSNEIKVKTMFIYLVYYTNYMNNTNRTNKRIIDKKCMNDKRCMNKKIITISLLLIVVIGLGIFLCGCTKQYIPVPDNNQTNQDNSSINSSHILVNNAQNSAVTFNNVVDANDQLAMDLYSRYKSEDGNMFFSPYSISSALAMTYEGARGKTAEEMQAVLHLPNDTEKIHSDFVSINNELNKADKTYALSVANALWAQKDFPFDDKYFNVVGEYYGGKVTNLDFKTDTENSRVTINNWVESKTNYKIKDLIPKGVIYDTTRLVLTNAIYFKANWSKQFNVRDTTDGQFTLNSGASKTVKMMHETSVFNYGETSDLQILEMDYLGNDLSMLIILPKDNNITKIENVLSNGNLDGWKSNMTDERVEVTLPKFKFENKYLMSNDLKEMGMQAAFDPTNADFTGMYNKNLTPDENLYISEVIHQTYVEVAEYGTEAAAATAVVMMTSSAYEPEEPKIFTADHPFVFIIQQKDTGNILFIGRVSDPTK